MYNHPQGIIGPQMGSPAFMADWTVRAAYPFVRSSVQKKTGANVNDLEPIEAAKRIDLPAVIITATEDEIVPPKHGEKLAEHYLG